MCFILSITSNFAETLLEFWKDLTSILDKHPKLLFLFDYQISGVEWSFVSTGENPINLLVYLLDINMKTSSTSRIRFKEIINTNSNFTLLQKEWNELSKMF